MGSGNYPIKFTCQKSKHIGEQFENLHSKYRILGTFRVHTSWDYPIMKERNLLVNTLVELAPEELDPHDGEDEPEHEAHQQHVEDGGDGVHQRIHHNLERSS